MKVQLKNLRNEISQIVKKIRVSQKFWDSVLLARRYPNKNELIIVKGSTI